MRHLACFFKSPEGVEENDFFKQFELLAEYVAGAKAPAERAVERFTAERRREEPKSELAWSSREQLDLCSLAASPLRAETDGFHVQLPRSTQRNDSPMRLAFSTNAYLRYPFDEAAERIAALGYEGLELLADVPHAWPAGLARRARSGRSSRRWSGTGWRSRTSTRS